MEPASDIEDPILGEDPDLTLTEKFVNDATWEIAYSKGLTTGLLMGIGIGILATILIYYIKGL